MEELLLTAERGRSAGSRPSKRLRAEGKVPAIVYGHGTEPMAVTVPWRELRAALTTEAGANALINLDVGGERHLTIVRDLQRDPVRNRVLHVDFVLVNRDESITTEVPIVLEGQAEQVRREQGVVEQQTFALEIHSRPGDIPANFTVDISGLRIGDTIRVGDLALPSGVTTDVDPEEPVVIATLSRAAIELEQAEEEQVLEQLAEAGVAPEELEELAAAEGGEAAEGEGEAEGEGGA